MFDKLQFVVAFGPQPREKDDKLKFVEHYLQRFFITNQMFAGRSASRRMK